jgi:hypothetical protein
MLRFLYSTVLDAAGGDRAGLWAAADRMRAWIVRTTYYDTIIIANYVQQVARCCAPSTEY